MLVCEYCHERDKDAIGCQYSADDHRNNKCPSYGPCEICGDHCEYVVCTKYPPHSEDDEKMRSEQKRCDKCKFFGECVRFALSYRKGDDPVKVAENCLTFVYNEEKNDGKDSGKNEED